MKKYILSLLLLCGVTLFCQAQPEIETLQNQDQYTQQQLSLAKQQTQSLQNSLDHFDEDKNKQRLKFSFERISTDDLEQCEFSIANSKATVDNIDIALNNTRESIKNSTRLLNTFKKQSVIPTQILTLSLAEQRSQEKIALMSILESAKERTTYLKKSRNLALQQTVLIKRWCQQLNNLYENQAQQSVSYQLVSDVDLQKKQQDLSQKLLILHDKLAHTSQSDSDASSKKIALEFDIFLAEQHLSINQLALFLSHLERNFRPGLLLDSTRVTILDLNKHIKQVEDTLNQIGQMIQLVKNKVIFVENNKKILEKKRGNASSILNQLVIDYHKQENRLDNFYSEVNAYHKQLQYIRRQQFSVRQTLPDLNTESLKNLAKQVWMIPKSFGYFLQGVKIQIVYKLNITPKFAWYYLGAVALLLILSWIFLRKTLISWLQKLELRTKRFSSQALSVFLKLIRQNLGLIFIIIALLSLLVFFKLEISFWVLLALIVLSYRILTVLTRLWLVEGEIDVGGKDIRLYRGLRWIFSLSGVAVIFAILAHTFPVAYEVTVLFNKILLFLLLGLSLLLLRAWSVLPSLLQRVFSFRRSYFIVTIRLLCIVIPIALLSNALIGLIGYVELAWTIAKYQVFALLVLTLYLVIRGVLIDLMELLYGLLIRHLKAGWLWGEAFARPLDRILRIALFLSMIWAFLHWSGIDQNPTFLNWWHQLLEIPIMKGVGTAITAPLLVGVTVFIIFLYWIAKWSREFAFRWLYKRSRDIGVRNSMSIFTQYAVVIIGVLIGLRVFGFDLTSLTVITAAFAAGVGFGMRDIISNFFSGILLLVERPFRTGDTITTGPYEGEVISTGMRSLKVRTWDHMEVMVPNADMFTKPFVNWTHQDNIVRSVAIIKMHPMDDPHQVQTLILTLLQEMDCVVEDPKPEVYLVEMTEALIEIEVQFYLNLEAHQSRKRVRSEVLFAVWDCFKKNGIRSPFPQYDVQLLDHS